MDIKERRKQYYIDNQESIKQKNLQYYYDNIEERQRYNNEYWALHGDKYKEERKIIRQNKRYNKNFKIVPNIIVRFD